MLLGPAVAAHHEGFPQRIDGVLGGHDRVPDPQVVCVEETVTADIMRTMEVMDFRPALWGRKRDEPMPMW